MKRNLIPIAVATAILCIAAGFTPWKNLQLINVFNWSPKEIWISPTRSDGLGLGTEGDPFDGHTQPLFDALLADNTKCPAGTHIHLLPGTFHISPHNEVANTNVKTGWWIEGSGMYITAVQIVGSLAGLRHVWAFSSPSASATDGVTVSDLTIDGNWGTIGSTADNGAGGEKNVQVSGVTIYGSNNLLDKVRTINTFGSFANLEEQFAMSLAASSTGPDATNDVIRNCKAELPSGNYGAPFMCSGSGSYKMRNSKITGCFGIGVNNGLNPGFTTGGFNVADVTDVEQSGNTWIDCAETYHDTGTLDGLTITGDVMIRGYQGVNLNANTTPQKNINIKNCSFQLQNRQSGAIGHVLAGTATANNVVISNNTFTVTSGGSGGGTIYPIFSGTNLTNSTISNNIIDSGYTSNVTSGASLFNNRDPNGSASAGLADNVFQKNGGPDSVYVTTSNHSTISTSLVDVTELVTGTLSANTVYRFEADMLCGTSADTNGTQYGVNVSVAPTFITAEYSGPGSVSGGQQNYFVVGTNMNNTANGTNYLQTASETGFVRITGIFKTAGTGSPVFSIRQQKTGLGTATVFSGSQLYIRAANKFP
jgi:hypothetical protein